MLLGFVFIVWPGVALRHKDLELQFDKINDKADNMRDGSAEELPEKVPTTSAPEQRAPRETCGPAPAWTWPSAPAVANGTSFLETRCMALNDPTERCPTSSKGPAKYDTTDPLIYGPILWMALHYISAAYPQADVEYESDPVVMKEYQNQAKAFVQSLPFLLPCGHCGSHFHDFLQRRDLDKDTMDKTSFIKLFVDAHNHVSKHVNQVPTYGESFPPKKLWSVAEAKAKYSVGAANGLDSNALSESHVMSKYIWPALNVLAAGYHTPNGDNTEGPAHPVLQGHAKNFLASLEYLLPARTAGSKFRAHLDSANLDAAVATKDAFIELVVGAQSAVRHHYYGGGFGPDDVLTMVDLKDKFFCVQHCVTDPRRWIDEGHELWQDVAKNPVLYQSVAATPEYLPYQGSQGYPGYADYPGNRSYQDYPGYSLY